MIFLKKYTPSILKVYLKYTSSLHQMLIKFTKCVSDVLLLSKQNRLESILEGNSMSNHPGHDILISQILFIFSLFVDTVQMINPWKLQLSISYGSEVIEIWKFNKNGCSRVKCAILNLRYL